MVQNMSECSRQEKVTTTTVAATEAVEVVGTTEVVEVDLVVAEDANKNVNQCSIRKTDVCVLIS
jgi:hypothetical protein